MSQDALAKRIWCLKTKTSISLRGMVGKPLIHLYN